MFSRYPIRSGQRTGGEDFCEAPTHDVKVNGKGARRGRRLMPCTIPSGLVQCSGDDASCGDDEGDLKPRWAMICTLRTRWPHLADSTHRISSVDWSSPSGVFLQTSVNIIDKGTPLST